VILNLIELAGKLDPKNILSAREWIALSTLIFTVFSFGITQYLSARSQRITRQLAVRPYFNMAGFRRNIDLSSDEKGVTKGKIITTHEFKELRFASKNNKQVNGKKVNKVYYLQLNNLGPGYALDCKFEIKVTGKNDKDTWKIRAYTRVIDKGEYIYIPLNNIQSYPLVQVEKINISFRTQSNEIINIIHKKQEDDELSHHTVYKKILFGLVNKKILELPTENGNSVPVD
jgi:hypothetical protein